jgi:hypothetical protein
MSPLGLGIKNHYAGEGQQKFRSQWVYTAMCSMYIWQSTNLFRRDNPILSSEGMLRKDYDRKGSVKKKSGHQPRRQDELIGGKPLVVK